MHAKGTESIRIGKDMLAKLRKMAALEGRTIRGQIERLLRASLG